MVRNVTMIFDAIFNLNIRLYACLRKRFAQGQNMAEIQPIIPACEHIQLRRYRPANLLPDQIIQFLHLPGIVAGEIFKGLRRPFPGVIRNIKLRRS